MKVIGRFVLILWIFVIIISSTTGCTKNKSADNNGINWNNTLAQVKPKNFNPSKLDFTINDINEVKIEHTDTSVKTEVLRILKGDEVSKFLSLLKTAKVHNGKIVFNNSIKIGAVSRNIINFKIKVTGRK